MFHEDMDDNDSNELSTDGSSGTKDNTNTATADTLVGTRVNTTREMARQLKEKVKHHQTMDLVTKRRLIMGSHYGILIPLP